MKCYIDHRLTRPYTPKTNGMIERYNGRVAKALRERKEFVVEF